MPIKTWVQNILEFNKTKGRNIPWTIARQTPLSMGFSRQEWILEWVAISSSSPSTLVCCKRVTSLSMHWWYIDPSVSKSQYWSTLGATSHLFTPGFTEMLSTYVTAAVQGVGKHWPWKWWKLTFGSPKISCLIPTQCITTSFLLVCYDVRDSQCLSEKLGEWAMRGSVEEKQSPSRVRGAHGIQGKLVSNFLEWFQLSWLICFACPACKIDTQAEMGLLTNRGTFYNTCVSQISPD